MNYEWIAQAFEKHWTNLELEQGTRLGSSYCRIVAKLHSESGPEELEKVADDLCDLLNESHLGRVLLRDYRSMSDVRLLGDSSSTLSETERTRLICNRLIRLPPQVSRVGESIEEDISPPSTGKADA